MEHEGPALKVLLVFSGLYCLSANAGKPIVTQRNYNLSLKLSGSLSLEGFQLISRV